MVLDRNRLLHVALRHGDAAAVKVLNGADGLELEARLVKKGVAKYVDEQPVAPAPAAKPEQEPETVPETGDAPATPEYDEDMKLDELKEVAAAYGVDASAMRKKADVIAAIEEAKAAANEADDDQTGDNEEPPQIGAADPV